MYFGRWTLNTGLYHVDKSLWCVTALLVKNNDKIDSYCRLALHNITEPQAHYLDQGLWAISVETPIPMKSNAKTTAALRP